MKWYKVANTADPTPFRKVEAGGKMLCLISYEGHTYALGAKCPHAGADLSTGWCDKGKLICPFHRYSYDLSTGKGSPGQNDYVDTYPVKIENDEIFIGITSFWEDLKNILK